MSTIRDFSDIPIISCNTKQARKYVQRHKMCISDADQNYLLDETERRYQIKYKRRLQNVE